MLVNEDDLKALEEEPDGLAADKDEDEREENRGASGVAHAAFVQHPGGKGSDRTNPGKLFFHWIGPYADSVYKLRCQSVVCLSPPGNLASWWTEDFWSKSASLTLAN